MRFTFSKITNGNDIDVTWRDENNEEYMLVCGIFDGLIEIIDICPTPLNGKYELMERLTKPVNIAFAERNVKKAMVRKSRAEHKITQHWWNTMSIADKLRLVSMLSDKIESIVDALLRKNPNDIKRRHYESLIKRSKAQSVRVDAVLLPDKLRKLPRYDAQHDELVGTDRHFIALAEVCYPPMVYSARSVRLSQC